MKTKYIFKIDTPFGKKGEEFNGSFLRSTEDGSTYTQFVDADSYPDLFIKINDCDFVFDDKKILLYSEGREYFSEINIVGGGSNEFITNKNIFDHFWREEHNCD